MKSTEKTWIGKRIRYSPVSWVTVIDEDDTHLVLKFDSGAVITSAKHWYAEPE